MSDLDNWIPKQARVFRNKKNTHGKKRFPNFETWCRFKMNKTMKKQYDMH
jgi:hypothetical protein